MKWNIILRDHNYGDTSEWEDALKCSFEVIFAGDNSATKDLAVEQTANAIIFLHYSNSDNRKHWIENLHSSSYLILVNTDGRTKDTDLPDRVFSCYWSPKEFALKARPRKFVESIVQGKQIDWSLLHPPPQDTILAARLLSQAAGYCNQTADEAAPAPGLNIYRPPDDLVAKADLALADLEKGSEVGPAITNFEEQMRRLQN